MSGKSRFVLLGLVVLVSLAAAVSYLFVQTTLKKTAQQALQAVASDLVGEEVHFEGLRTQISLDDQQRLALRLTKIDGFKSDELFKFDQAILLIEGRRLFSNPTRIAFMEVSLPTISHAWLDGGSADASSSGRAERSYQGLQGRDFIIERLLLKDGFLLATVPWQEKPLRIALPDLEMTDVGADGNEATPGEALRQVVSRKLNATQQELSESELADMAEEVARDLADWSAQMAKELEALGKSLGEAAKETGKALQDLFSSGTED